MSQSGIRRNLPLFALAVMVVLWSGCIATYLLKISGSDIILIALHNWKDYGYFHLHGQFVINPGGIAPGEKEQFYAGHRPVSALPEYVSGLLLGGPSQSLLPFYLILSTITAVAIWLYFQRSNAGALLAALVILSPGYGRYALGADPIGVPILIGIPVMLLVIHLLESEAGAAWKRVALVLLILFLYTSLNWAVIFSVAPALTCVVLARSIRLKSLLPILAGAALLILLVTLISVSAKFSPVKSGAGMGAAPSAFERMWESYLWGSKGYAGPTPFSLFLTRVIAANVMGLLPLLLYYACVMGKELRQSGAARLAPSIAPLAVAILGVLAMRNLFAHHPWMAGPPLISGLMFSLVLLERRRQKSEPAKRSDYSAGYGAALAGAAAYLFFMLLAMRAYAGEEPQLVDLVHAHTSRHSLILLAPDMPQQAITESDRLANVFDRKVGIYGAGRKNAPMAESAVYVLSSTKLPDQPPGHLSLVASTGGSGGLLKSSFDGLFRFYQRHIARRAQNDRINLDSGYNLYRVIQP